jgi:Mg-chelatase subunit ChlD
MTLIMNRFRCLILLAWALAGTALSAQRQATLLDHRDRIRTTRLDILNSRMRETNLSITPDGKYLFFMSLRGGQEWSQIYMLYREEGVYDGDIWYSQKVNGKWTAPKCLPLGINTASGEDEPNISMDGQTVYFQSWNSVWEYTGGPYYRAKRNGSNWSNPVGLGGGITEFFKPGTVPATDGMSISPDEKRFIVAAGPDYDRPMDLYMSRYTPQGWSYCQKLPISTSGDERSVFLAADGKTLYFASDGYGGFGGLDIFKTTLNPDGTFGEVLNIGAPFNTPSDDYGFILTADGMEGYFVRNGDIYFADLSEADPRIRPGAVRTVHLVQGTVRDSLTWKGLGAELLVMDAYSKRIVQKVQASPQGKYSFTLPNQDGVYDLIAVSEGYRKRSQRLKSQQSPVGQTYTQNFLLGKGTGDPRPAIVSSPPPPQPPAQQPKPQPSVPAITQVKPPAKTPAVQPAPAQAPPPKPLVQDPYDFSGVARNNLILLLDVSASMQKPDKLPLLKESLQRLLTHMRGEDLISIIAYSGDAAVMLDGVSAARREDILKAIGELRSSGSTDGRGALRKAYDLAAENFIAGGNNRIILATDGYFEVSDLYPIAERNRSRNVQLSVFSFGKLTPEREDQLESLARIGGGNYANIRLENANEALLKEAKAVRAAP